MLRELCILVLIISVAAGSADSQTTAFAISSHTGVIADELFGAAIAALGDLDGDGFDDYAIGSPWAAFNGPQSGSVRVVSGRNGATIRTHNGNSVNDYFGEAVASAGDVDGDMVPDVVVGAWGDVGPGGTTGSARVFSGASGLPIHTMWADGAGDRFGFAVDGDGDFDGDGTPDVAVGAYFDDNTGNDTGSVRLISGATGMALRTLNGVGNTAYFGASVAIVSDVNSDGCDDVAVGAPNDGNSVNAGSVTMFSGSTGAVLWKVWGTTAADEFGRSLDGGHDVNGDGIDDVITGAPGDDDLNGLGVGSVWVLSGASGAPVAVHYGDSSYDHFGISVALIGDTNGDLRSEYVTGAWKRDSGGLVDSGGARLYDGASGLTLTDVWGAAAGEQAGYAVAGVGDPNADGIPDFGVGSPRFDTGLRDIGRAIVFSVAPVIPYRGSGQDLVLGSGVNHLPTINSGRKSAMSGDVVVGEFASPLGRYDFTPAAFLAQIMPTGSIVTSPVPGYAEVHVNPALSSAHPIVSLLAVVPGLGGVVIPGGTSLGFVIPAGLTGQSLLMQAFSFAPNPSNPFFTATDCHVIDFM